MVARCRHDAERLEQLIAVVGGAVVNALIEADPDPRAAAARMVRQALSGQEPA